MCTCTCNLVPMLYSRKKKKLHWGNKKKKEKKVKQNNFLQVFDIIVQKCNMGVGEKGSREEREVSLVIPEIGS